jgi:hypothetical protein
MEGGPEDIQLLFRADGVVIFDFSKSLPYSGGEIPRFQLDEGNVWPREIQRRYLKPREDIRERRAIYVNAFLACFNTALTPTGRLTAPFSSMNYLQAHQTGGNWVLNTGGQKLAPMCGRAFTVQAGDLIAAADLFRRDIGIETGVRFDLFGLYYRSAFHSQSHDFQGCLALAWVVIEKCQNILWNRFISGGYKSVNPQTQIDSNRKQALSNGRDYTASIKGQILSLAGIFTDQELSDVDAVRRLRNSFMHNLERVDVQAAVHALHVAGTLISKVLGTRFHLSGGPPSWG